MKRAGNPQRGEVVICRITELNPNSAYAELVEYDKKGIIHVTEVAKRWVRDIREFLKPQQFVVCKVMGVDERGISLSIKRVHKEEASKKLNEFKREGKAEKMLELAAKELGKTLEQAHKEVGGILHEELGGFSKAFDTAAKNPELLKQKGVPKSWADVIVKVAEAKKVEKTYEVRGQLTILSYKPNGVEEIKKALSLVKEPYQVKYLTAPKYLIVGHGKDIKKLKAGLQELGERLAKEFERQGEGKFQTLET